MSKNKETVGYTFTVAFLVCLVCAIIVSTAAVSLKETQNINKELDKNKNILAAANLLGDYDLKSVPKQYVQDTFANNVEIALVDFSTGKFVTDIDAVTYDQAKAAKDPKQSAKLAKKEDVAGIKRRENIAKVYLVKEAGEIDRVVLPIRGYGLWSTLWGFVALEGDLNTVVGLTFYQHAETPGLGGEVDNPTWKAQWPSKKVYASDGSVAIEVVKKGAPLNADHSIDGLAGATLTARGVDNLVKYWLGEDGFKTFLTNLKAGEA